MSREIVGSSLLYQVKTVKYLLADFSEQKVVTAIDIVKISEYFFVN